MNAVVQLDEVSRSFGSGHTQVVALHPTTLSVGEGEFIAIMGPSGSGKTTLLSLIGGLDRPTSGRMVVGGHDLAGLNGGGLAVLRRRVVGYVFQDLNLLAGLTARENIALPLELDGRPAREVRAAADSVLQSLGLSELGDRFPNDLSGGEQQRVAIGRALVGDRRVLLADEPTGALDSMTGESVMRLLRTHCNDGGTVVLVTHDAAHAAWADRVIFLRDGRIVDEAKQDQPEPTQPVAAGAA